MRNFTIAQMHEAKMIDENSILIDDRVTLKFVEAKIECPPRAGVLCRYCFFHRFACDNIPCTKYERDNGLDGYWVVDKITK